MANIVPPVLKDQAILQALKEIEEENFRKEVDRQKRVIRDRKLFWKRLFPWTIKIERVK